MGGHPGVGSECKSFFEDYPKHPEDYYSTTSCVNCHNSPPKIESIDPVCDGYLPRPSPCSAEIRWPDHLQTGIRNIEKYPWWIDQNYTSTKISKDNYTVNSQKLDFGVTVYLNPNVNIPIENSGYEIQTGKNAKVSSNFVTFGRGSDLSLLLENQTLFEIQNVNVDVGWWDIFGPNKIQNISVKEGHPILGASIGLLNLFRSEWNPSSSEFDNTNLLLANLPVVYHEETGKTLTLAKFDILSDTEKRKHQRLEVLYDIAHSGLLPERIRIEDLYHLFQNLFQAAQKAKTAPPDLTLAKKLISSIGIQFGIKPEEFIDRSMYVRFRDSLDSNNFKLSLNTNGLSGIKDFQAGGNLDAEEVFIPGVAHLGNTTAQVQVTLDPLGKISVGLDHIQSEIKPIDYFKPHLRALGPFQIEKGQIQDGGETTFEGIKFLPGIHLETQGAGTVLLQMNLSLNVETKVAVPLLGEVKVTLAGPVLLQTTLKKVEVEKTDELGEVTKTSEWKWVPHTTLIALPSLELKAGDSLIPATAKGQFVFTDMPGQTNGTLTTAPTDGFLASFKADEVQFGMFQKGSWELALPLPKDTNGFYDFAAFKKAPELDAALHFNLTDKTQLLGNLSLDTTEDKSKTNYKFAFSLDQKDEAGLKMIEPWIKEALLNLTTEANSPNSLKTEIDLKARQIAFDPKFVGTDFIPIYIHTPKFHLSYSENQRENQLLDWTIHSLELTGNPWVKRPYRGLIHGPILLKTYSNPSRELTFVLDTSAHKLDVKNLNARFDFKGLAIPGLWEGFDGKVSSLDIDGSVHGWWTMNTETYKGRGQCVFRGDKEGDIIFRGAKGRRLEARLNPDDPDRLYEIPLFADTTYTIDRIDSVDTARERINGHFVLKTLVDFMVLRALGIEWNQHSKLTFEHNHLPYTKNGFDIKIREFFRDVEAEQEKAKRKAKSGGTP